MLAMIILFATIFGTISIVEDRAQGFLQAVLVAPGSRLALVLGKVLGVTSLAIIQVALFAMLAPVAGFSMHSVRWGVLAAVSVLAAIGLTAMNFTVAWLINSVQGYHAIMGIVLFPLWFLSGAMFPRATGPLGVAMGLNPMTYLVDGLRAAFSPEALGPNAAALPTVLGALAAHAMLMLALAAWICRRRIDPRGRTEPVA
jgi:ABC-type multidrug transport system permease subunit